MTKVENTAERKGQNKKFAERDDEHFQKVQISFLMNDSQMISL